MEPAWNLHETFMEPASVRVQDKTNKWRWCLYLHLLVLSCTLTDAGSVEVPRQIPFSIYFAHNSDFPDFQTTNPHRHISTSSTAQGGGGSFKNRKPIGELGCCESGMAERSH